MYSEFSVCGSECASASSCHPVTCYLAFVVCGGDVHLLLDHVVDVGGGAALDPFFLLPLQLVGHHLDGLCPLISELKRLNIQQLKAKVSEAFHLILHDH